MKRTSVPKLTAITFPKTSRDFGSLSNAYTLTDIEFINNTIFNELCCGIINQKSKEKFLLIVDKLKNKGAEGIILGCTEIIMLISQDDINIPVFDTTKIHAEKAAELSLI